MSYEEFEDAVSEPGKRRARPPRSHNIAKVLVMTLLSLTLVTGMAGAYVVRNLNSHIDQGALDDADQLNNRPLPKVKGAVNILVMGSDTRAGDNNIDGDKSEGARSDTTILLHLSADKEHAYGISIPRDTMVPRPECELKNGDVLPAEERVIWNDAFEVGGPACTMQQFETLTGIRLDHFVVVDFSGFKGMVDAIGGVEVCLQTPVDDTEHGIQLAAGPQVVTGDEALSFVRVRSGIGDGSDTGRLKRQQAFIASMANKVLSAETLADPIKVVSFATEVAKSVKLSESLADVQKLAGLGYEFRDINARKVKFTTVPWQPDPADPNRVAMRPEAAELWEKIINDEPLAKQLGDGAISAKNPHSDDKPSKKANEEAESAGLCT